MTDQAPPPGYSNPPASYGSPYAPQPATERFNVLSIVGFVLAFVVSLGAVICGHIALSQIKRTGERGRGLAIAALVLGYLGILVGIIVAFGAFGALITAGGAGSLNN